MSERRAFGLAYRWIGAEGQYLNGVPARDLYPQDILEVADREGITEEDIRLSGLYEPAEFAEIEPFCGAALPDGGRCREPVADWGLRCERHGSLTQITGIGPATARELREADVGTVADLAALPDEVLTPVAERLPRVTVERLAAWRGQAVELCKEEESDDA